MKSIKKIFAILLTLALVIAAVPMVAVSADTWDGKTIATKFESGTGTEADPFIIKTAAQLAYLAQSIKVEGAEGIYTGKYFKLGADIDLANNPWQPIGVKGFPFSGVFDGADHTVSGLFVETEDIYAGLFGFVETGVIKNISILGTKSSSKKYSGTAAGQAVKGSSIINVYAQVDHIFGEAAGGIVGRMEKLADGETTYNQIIYCHSKNGKVEAKAGLYSSGSTAYAGGITAATGHTEIRYCTNSSEVYVDSEAHRSLAGGIIACHGASSGPAIVDHCINTGKISSNYDAYLGGIIGKIGHIDAGKVIYNLNTGTIEGDNATLKGGIAGGFSKMIDIGGYAFNYTTISTDVLPLIGGDPAMSEVCDDFYGGTKSTIFYIEPAKVDGAGALANLEGFTSDIWKDGVTIPEADLNKVLALVESGKWEAVEPDTSVTTPVVTTPDTTVADTTVADTTVADTTATPETPANTTAKPAPTAPAATTAAKSEGGCGSVVSGAVVVIALAGAAYVVSKKKRD